MSVAEILAFTVGLTILITSLSALAVSIVGIPITEFAVVIVGLPLAVIAFLLRRPATNPWMAFVDFARRLFDFSDYTKGEKGVVAALYVVVVGAVVFLVSLANVHYPDAPSVGLALTGPDGTSNSLNRSFVLGQPKSITVTVMGNDTASSYELRIRLVPLNATGTEPFHTVSTTTPLRMDAFGEFSQAIALAVGASWTQSFTIALDTTGTSTWPLHLANMAWAARVGGQLPLAAIEGG